MCKAAGMTISDITRPPAKAAQFEACLVSRLLGGLSEHIYLYATTQQRLCCSGWHDQGSLDASHNQLIGRGS
jgi:hypothetical protein